MAALCWTWFWFCFRFPLVKIGTRYNLLDCHLLSRYISMMYFWYINNFSVAILNRHFQVLFIELGLNTNRYEILSDPFNINKIALLMDYEVFFYCCLLTNVLQMFENFHIVKTYILYKGHGYYGNTLKMDNWLPVYQKQGEKGK